MKSQYIAGALLTVKSSDLIREKLKEVLYKVSLFFMSLDITVKSQNFSGALLTVKSSILIMEKTKTFIQSFSAFHA